MSATQLRRLLVAALIVATAAFAIGVTIEKAEEGESGHAATESILGIDAESTPLIVLAVFASLGLIAALVLRPGVPLLLLATAAFGAVFATLDIVELVRKLDQDEASIAAFAAVAAVFHAAVAVIAMMLRAWPSAPGR